MYKEINLTDIMIILIICRNSSDSNGSSIPISADTAIILEN